MSRHFNAGAPARPALDMALRFQARCVTRNPHRENYAHHVGGDRNARDKDRDHPWYQDAVDFCHNWDQCAFDPDYESLPLEFFEPMVRRVFAREPFGLVAGGDL